MSETKEIKISSAVYETILNHMMELAVVLSKFPLPVIVAGVEKIQQACKETEDEAFKKECEGLRKHRLELQQDIAFALKVAQLGINNARDKYAKAIEEHPEWKERSGLVVPKNAGKIWMPGQ